MIRAIEKHQAVGRAVVAGWCWVARHSADNMGLGSEELGWPQSPGPFKTTKGCGTTRHKGISPGGLKAGKIVSLWVLVG